MSDKNKAKDFRAEREKRLQARNRLIADTRGEILRMLDAARKRVVEILAGQPSEAELWLLPQLQREIELAMREFGDAASARVSTAAGAAWEAGQALIDAPLAAGGIAIAGAAPVLDTRQLVAMRAFMTDRIKDIGVQAVNRINAELGLTVMGAQAPAEAIGKVTAILKQTSRERAITIVRTELSRAYGTAAFERLKQAAELDPDLKKQWRRSGKAHSRLAHDMADGQVQPVDKPFVLASGARLMFPHDPKAPPGETINCGCTLLPIRDGWEVASRGRRRYIEQEMQANPMKRDIQDELDAGRPVGEILKGARAA